VKKARQARAIVPAARYITREDLATLRDEIEELVGDATQRVDNAMQHLNVAIKVATELERAFEGSYEKNKRLIETMHLDVRRMKAVLGLDKVCPPYSAALGEHVAASYFHSWIARINERLDRLEAKSG
jgi:hypothetical protein